MKKILILLLISNLSFAHEDKMIQKSYGNVSITTFASDYVEEMNKTLLVAQYAELLAKKLNYTGKIYLLFSEEQLKPSSITCWMDKEESSQANVINAMFRFKDFSIRGCMNVIENTLINAKKIAKFKDKNFDIYNGSSSPMVIKVLETRLYRPNEINELEKPSLYSYYVEGGKYHLIRKERDKEEELSVLDNILDYQIISKDIVIVFTTFDELQIIQTKKPIIIEKITEVPNFYWPYNAHLVGDNKILFEFYWRSEQKNRMMIYYIEENLFVQSLDKVILSSLNDDKDYLLIVPNAFTPNNDLANESFKPITKGLKKIRLDIYDTWGSLIYSEIGDNLEGWDGKIKGEKADNGNYSYKVVGEKFDGINVEREGTFALVR